MVLSLWSGILVAEDSPLSFTPEAEGRREVSVKSENEDFEWRLRIPERVFCDEGVLVGHDIFRVHERVTWSRDKNNRLQFRRDNLADTARESYPIRIEYALVIEPQSDGAKLHLTMKNIGKNTLHNVTGHICLGHLSDPFRDPVYERTYIRADEKFLNLHETGRGSDPIRAHYRIRNQPAIKIFDNPNNRFWGPLSPEQPDNGLILTQSKSGSRIVALWFDPASEVFQNSDEPNMCIHSDPTFGDLEPNESVTVTGRLILFGGDLKAFESAYVTGGN